MHTHIKPWAKPKQITAEWIHSRKLNLEIYTRCVGVQPLQPREWGLRKKGSYATKSIDSRRKHTNNPTQSCKSIYLISWSRRPCWSSPVGGLFSTSTFTLVCEIAWPIRSTPISSLDFTHQPCRSTHPSGILSSRHFLRPDHALGSLWTFLTLLTPTNASTIKRQGTAPLCDAWEKIPP